MKIQWKPFIIALAIPLVTGLLAALLTGRNMMLFQMVNLPPLAPPGRLFPVIWTILYLLMGFASYLIYVRQPKSGRALLFYFLQLCVNFFWPILFFNQQLYLISFLWIILLWLLVLFTFAEFYCISRIAGCCLIPYLVWVTIAGYLNLGIYLLN